ncbi:3-oxoacyl-ACP synthase III family protein [Hymenobacter psychrophilus]|uniref:3-oxoacyl-[acyl-carrier-protein] synthase-3 n=1 Tax=Hymenobacter psychrophilus TaxID=651662 RepID=A0A1H3IQ19_9BACT|nr:ketoacyl-ACP synthase III [Hymenobacter psychrophilus]SDY29198.1 3-oxoacyl-[acyl-carrier-protein] synthase-3 [Hymenobacter psychrophilus]
MRKAFHSVITGTGSCIPTRVVKNDEFVAAAFYDGNGQQLDKPGAEIVERFAQITDIHERRYAEADQVASDLALLAAQELFASSPGADPEQLDYILVAHNFGDITEDNRRSDFVPSLAARVKHKLGIVNPHCVAYDLPFGCPGWLQGVIQADYYLRSGDAKRVLVIGTETLSRVCDPHDRDSMIYSDGAGAVLLEARETADDAAGEPVGILAHSSRSDTAQAALLLRMASSRNREYTGTELFLQMEGRKLYEYALKTVPQAIKACLEKAGLGLPDMSRLLIHQANGKMDEAILKRLYALDGDTPAPVDIMPMTISWLGNSSVATLPTLLDLLTKGQLEGYTITPGEVLVFASVGAGMNCNAVVYRVPEVVHR